MKIVNGYETFKDADGKIYARPSDINIGMHVAVIRDNEIHVKGAVENLRVVDGQIYVFVDVGGPDPIPRMITEVAAPLL